MASCGDIGGNGTPRFGGRPGLELNSENKLFFIRPGGMLVRREGRERKNSDTEKLVSEGRIAGKPMMTKERQYVGRLNKDMHA